MSQTEYVPTPDEILNENRWEIENADTKTEALEAIEPVLAVCVLYDQMDENEDLPLGGPHAIDLAEITPLSVEEIRGKIEQMTWELVEGEVEN